MDTIQTIYINAVSSNNLGNGTTQLYMTSSQIAELQQDLDSMISAATTLEEKRSYFFNNEGYMASDQACVRYWDEHREPN